MLQALARSRPRSLASALAQLPAQLCRGQASQSVRSTADPPTSVSLPRADKVNWWGRHQQGQAWSSVFVGIGSNLGDRNAHIQDAVARIRRLPLTRLERTSLLYETESFYDSEQPCFLNGVLKLRTRLSPHTILDELQRIEREMGRTATKYPDSYRYPARPIDLDILLFNCMQLSSDRLTLPHPRLADRGFVLRPLCDVDPGVYHPVFGKTAGQLLAGLLNPPVSGAGDSQAPLPLARDSSPIDPRLKASRDRACMSLDPAGHNMWYWDRGGGRTHIMGVVNVTPDSFSDGGDFFRPERAVQRALELLQAGADVVDVGGQSTRPGAGDAGLEEEFRRVLPVVQGLCEALRDPEVYARCRRLSPSVAVSVDTFRAEVIRQAYSIVRNHNLRQRELMEAASGESGAVAAPLSAVAGYVGFLANDVSGGQLDSDMLPTVADLGIPYVLSHFRAPPADMQRPAHLEYEGGVVAGVAAELGDALGRAQASGVPLWNLVLDPGIGFSKTSEQCYELIAALREACPAPLPILSGPSRKSFMVPALEQGGFPTPPGNEERDWGTAAAVTASIGSGASLVRVHNVVGARAAVLVADRIFRRLPKTAVARPRSPSPGPP